MGHEGRREAIDSFSSLVRGEQKAALHIITPYDCHTSAWTVCKPEASVLSLATRAAATSAGQLLRYISSERWRAGSLIAGHPRNRRCRALTALSALPARSPP